MYDKYCWKFLSIFFLDETALASPGEIEVEDNTVPPTELTVKADRPTPIFEKEDLKMVFIEDIMRERTLLEDSVVITLPPLPQIEEDETTVVINPAKDLQPTTISIANLPGMTTSNVNAPTQQTNLFLSLPKLGYFLP